MTKLNIKTLGELVEKDNKKTGDVKRMIDQYGVYYRNRWHEQEAAPRDASGSEKMIAAAISALGNYADIFDERAPMEAAEEYYSDPNHHDIYRFGFQAKKDGKLFVDKTAVQNQEELIEQLQSELASIKIDVKSLREQLNEISTWTGFDDVNDELIPKEHDVALQVYSSAIRAYNPETGEMDNNQPIKKWLKHKASEFFEDNQGDATYERVATVANWKKEAGRPRKN